MKVEIKHWEWILLIIFFIAGFFIGRLMIKEKATEEVQEKISYVLAPYAVHDTILKPVPYLEYRTKLDTIYVPSDNPAQPIDTLRIVEDYFLTRQYRLDFSADTIGTFIVDAKVHQNRLISTCSEIRPVIRTVEREKTVYGVRAAQFYGILGTSVDLTTQKISAGVDLKQRYLIGVSGIRLHNNYSYTIDFGIKF